MVITANKIANETKTISKEVGTRDVSTGLKKLQDFYDLAVADENVVKDFVRDNFFKNNTVSNLQKLQAQEKQRKLQLFKADFGVDVEEFFEKLESDLAVTQKMILFLKGSSGLKLLKDAEIVDFKSNFGYTRYRLKNPVLNIDWNDQYNIFALLAKEFGKDLADDIVDISSKISENIVLNNIGRWKTPNKSEELRYFDESIRSHISELLKAVISKDSSVARKVYLNLSKNKLILIQERHNVLGKDEQKDDVVLIVDIKNEGLAQRTYSKAIRTGESDELFSVITKRIVSGIKSKIKNLASKKLTLKQVQKDIVPLEMLSDEQIISSDLMNYRTMDLLYLCKHVKDKKQISRLVEVIAKEIRNN